MRSLREETMTATAGGPGVATDAEEAGGEQKTRRAASVVASAEDEIRVLEERVRALERELSTGVTPPPVRSGTHRDLGGRP